MLIKIDGNCEIKGDLDMIMGANLMAHNMKSSIPFLDSLEMMATQKSFSNIL